jgi:hypothetical protein
MLKNEPPDQRRLTQGPRHLGLACPQKTPPQGGGWEDRSFFGPALPGGFLTFLITIHEAIIRVTFTNFSPLSAVLIEEEPRTTALPNSNGSFALNHCFLGRLWYD